MALGLNGEGTKQKYTYQKQFTNWSWKVGVDYVLLLKFFYFNSLLVVTVNYINQKIMEKEMVDKEAWKIKKLIIQSLQGKQQQR